MNYQPGYPTMEHAKAADEIVTFFREDYPIDALLLEILAPGIRQALTIVWI